MTIEPGPTGDAETCRIADEWVASCLKATRHLNTPAAAAWVQANPPSAEAIARLAWKAHEWETSSRNSAAASNKRSPVTDEELLADRAAFAARNGGSQRGWLAAREQKFLEWRDGGKKGSSPLSMRQIATRLKRIRK